MRHGKKKTVSQLKKEADRIFSLFIRRRDDQCFTCGNRNNLQNGHFISRTHSATRYSEVNCRAQCINCNVFRRGNYAEFAARLLENIGRESFDSLIKLGRTTHQFTVKELQDIIEKYKV